MNDLEFAADALCNWENSSDDEIAAELRGQTQFTEPQIAAILAQRDAALRDPLFFRIQLDRST